jgi:hypothetical protein
MKQSMKQSRRLNFYTNTDDKMTTNETTPVQELTSFLLSLRRERAEELDWDSMTDYVVLAMEFISKYKKLNGQEKKECVKQALSTLIRESDSLPDGLESAAAFLVPRLIDQLISVEKGRLRFKRKPKCFSCRFTFPSTRAGGGRAT